MPNDRSLPLSICALIVAVTAIHCGSDPNNAADAALQVDATVAADAPGGNADTSTPRDGGSADATLQPDASAPADAQNASDSGPASTPSGYVTLFQNMAVYTGVAGFTENSGAGCNSTNSGPCVTTRCSGGTTPIDVSAGDIVISGGALTGGVLLTPNSNNTYPLTTEAGRAFQSGQMIRFRAAGAAGGVPAFEQTVTAPSDVTVTTPTVTFGMPVTIRRADGLVVGWTQSAASDADLVVQLSQGTFGGPTALAVCTFDGAAGTGTVPSAALSAFMAGSGAFTVYHSGAARLNAGAYSVRVQAVSSGANEQALFE